jgi:FSR family fosmidomycin resistance protein-like MFS transporter
VTASVPDASRTAIRILAALSLCHFLNDVIQSMIPSIYPILKESYALDFGQIGLITFANAVTASLLQPVVGWYTDRRPLPQSLALAMAFTVAGVGLLAVAPGFSWILLAVALVGVGSSVFHPESSRVARVASGGRHGFAQSVFQVGGNAGTAAGPLAVALIVLPVGQPAVAWFMAPALVAMALLARIGKWYRPRIVTRAAGAPHRVDPITRRIAWSIAILVVLVFSKNVYLAVLTSFYTFYLMDTFRISVQSAQIHLFVLLAATAAGTFIGGPIGDRIGRKYVIWFSILGVLPFTLLLPYASLFWTEILSVAIGLILGSAFSAIVVFGQELVPGRVGAIAGLFFGLAFGTGGLGAALMGQLADATSIRFVYQVCSFLPALGLLTAFLPHVEPHRATPSRQPRPVRS